jgi:starch-binding outer membrane protein SusE/F
MQDINYLLIKSFIMKNISRVLFLSSFLAIFLFSCKKDEVKNYFEGGTAPVLTASTTAITLGYATAADEAIKLSWTNPNYTFTTGVSSQDVAYLVEIDKAGNNFTNPQKQTIAVSKALSLSISQTQFNDYMLNQLVLPLNVQSNLEIRVIASFSSGAAALVSNVLSVTATPYAIPPKVPVPIDGTLWMLGDAAPSGWSNPLPSPYDASQQFTQVSETLYELTVDLPGGGGYKLIQQQGDWGKQYHMLAGGTWEGGDFEKKDSDPQFPGPVSSGTYKISVDFQRGKFTVTKQ